MRRMTVYMIAITVLVVALPLPLAAQTPAQLPPEQIERIETVIASKMARQSIPALSIAIAVNNRIVYANGFGFADLENFVPARADTLYRTASIAKPMTATAVLQLVERGKLDLDAPIQQYCPAFPEKNWRVTARQLLGHLGGVRHYKSMEEATGKKHYFSVVESLELFKNDPLLHEPGTKFSYTTFGYVLLGCAIEGASGMSYLDYMQKNVFDPAGMHRTGPDDVHRILPNRARGYVVLDEDDYESLPDAAKADAEVGALYNASLHDTSMKVPGGGLVSTAIDLVKFALAHNTGLLLEEETREQMWTRQATRDGQQTKFGLGWLPIELPDERPPGVLVLAAGGQPGTSTLLVLRPDRGRAIALMVNLQGMVGNLRRLSFQVRMALMGESEPPTSRE